MSSGNFQDSKYGATYNTSNVHPIRVQPETVAAQFNDPADTGTIFPNDPPSGSINNPISALTGLTRGSKGLRPRFVVVKWTSSPPAGYTGDTARIAILDKVVFDAINVGWDATYLTTAATVTAKEPERAR